MSMKKLDCNALMMMCLTFGGANGPYIFPDILIEPVTDLGNDLLNCEDWDHLELFSLLAHKINKPILLVNDMPFGPAILLDVDAPLSSNKKMEDFIDDIVTCGCCDQN